MKTNKQMILVCLHFGHKYQNGIVCLEVCVFKLYNELTHQNPDLLLRIKLNGLGDIGDFSADKYASRWIDIAIYWLIATQSKSIGDLPKKTNIFMKKFTVLNNYLLMYFIQPPAISIFLQVDNSNPPSAEINFNLPK